MWYIFLYSIPTNHRCLKSNTQPGYMHILFDYSCSSTRTFIWPSVPVPVYMHKSMLIGNSAVLINTYNLLFWQRGKRIKLWRICRVPRPIWVELSWTYKVRSNLITDCIIWMCWSGFKRLSFTYDFSRTNMFTCNFSPSLVGRTIFFLLLASCKHSCLKFSVWGYR